MLIRYMNKLGFPGKQVLKYFLMFSLFIHRLLPCNHWRGIFIISQTSQPTSKVVDVYTHLLHIHTQMHMYTHVHSYTHAHVHATIMLQQDMKEGKIIILYEYTVHPPPPPLPHTHTRTHTHTHTHTDTHTH